MEFSVKKIDDETIEQTTTTKEELSKDQLIMARDGITQQIVEQQQELQNINNLLAYFE